MTLDRGRRAQIEARLSAGDQTRVNLVETAERLFALHGIEAISMRRIGEEAGCANNSVVKYHFGDKATIVEAVYRHRRPWLRQRRQALLQRAQERGALTVRSLIEVILVPLTELKDAEGRHMYARFLWQLRQPDLGGNPPFELLLLTRRTDGVSRHLRMLLPHLPDALFDERLSSLVQMFIHRLITQDSMPDIPARQRELTHRDAFGMMALALAFPPDGELLDMLGENT